MRLLLLIGFSKTDDFGNPDLASKLNSSAAVPGTDDARTLASIFDKAKRLHDFPRGVKWLGFGSVETTEVAVFISDAVGEQIAGREQQRMVSLEASLKRAEELKARQTAVNAAQDRLRKAAMAENDIAAALQTAKNRALDAEANFKTTKADSAKAELEAAKIKVVELEKLSAESKESLALAKKALAESKNPSPTESSEPPKPQFTI